ncbi:MAG TPA: RNA polymerase sigma factor, partial [Phenylobacterium sp.]|nr:RNA polymerase sigma factor [Phenylobacterium sp.]
MDSWPEPTDLPATLVQHHDAAWAWAMACCRRDRDAAHDVLHDVYVKVLQRRARFSGRSSFKTWLFGVIRLSAFAANRRRTMLGLLLEPIGEQPQLAAPLADARTIAMSQLLRRTLSTLPGRQRDVAILVFEHDLTLEEAGAVLGVSTGACRQHYARAKSKLRAAMSLGGWG